MKKKTKKKILRQIDRIIMVGQTRVVDQDELIDMRRAVKLLLDSSLNKKKSR